MKIYTKTGDKGETGLVGNTRIKKTSARIKAIGEVDELNAAIGLARTESQGAEIDEHLAWIQSALFDLGAELASLPGAKLSFAILAPAAARHLEESIDSQTSKLEPLRTFILPGGTKLAAHLHLARCICRRAERAVLELHEEESLRSEVLVFLNRLSDWLFVAARTSNRQSGIEDVAWQPAKTSG
jgi:cob(I)alamin adenosyltransferase